MDLITFKTPKANLIRDSYEAISSFALQTDPGKGSSKIKSYFNRNCIN